MYESICNVIERGPGRMTSGCRSGTFGRFDCGQNDNEQIEKHVVKGSLDTHNSGGKFVCIAWPYQPNILH